MYVPTHSDGRRVNVMSQSEQGATFVTPNPMFDERKLSDSTSPAGFEASSDELLASEGNEYSRPPSSK